MKVDKISRLTKMTKSLICFYGKAGSGKTTALLKLLFTMSESVLYITTESGFKTLQSMLQVIEDIYLKAKSSSLEESLGSFASSRPDMSKQLLDLYKELVEMRLSKPDDWILEIDHIGIDAMTDLYSPDIFNAYNKKEDLSGINMSKKEILILDTLTAYSDLVVKERSRANAKNSNKFATWGEHFSAITKLMDDMTMSRGIKILIGHEEYDKKTETYALALQGESIKEIGKRFTAILYAGVIVNKETQEHKRVIISNKDSYEFKTDAKCQDARISEIEPLDMLTIINKIKN